MIKKLFFIAFIVCMSISGIAHADEPIDLVPIHEETPEAVKDPRPIQVNHYEHDQKDIEKLARLLWSSPLRSETAKKELVYVVLNRADSGEPFDDTIQGCINNHEFDYFDSHAHRSEENLRIVREAMDEWQSRKDGNNVGKVVRIDAYYVRFYGANNRQIKLLDINRNPLG